METIGRLEARLRTRLAPGAAPLPEGGGRVEMRGVSLRYREARVDADADGDGAAGSAA